jgi:hypothetical protein
MKCMPALKEMHGPQPLLPPGVSRATTHGHILHQLSTRMFHLVIVHQQPKFVI